MITEAGEKRSPWDASNHCKRARIEEHPRESRYLSGTPRNGGNPSPITAPRTTSHAMFGAVGAGMTWPAASQASSPVS